MITEPVCTYSRAGLSLFTRKPFKHGDSWTWNINTKSKYSQSNNVSPFSSLQCFTRRKSACIIHHILRHTPLHPIYLLKLFTPLFKLFTDCSFKLHFFTAMVNIHIQQFAQCKYKYSLWAKRQFCFGFLSWFCITAMNRYLSHGHLGHTALMVSLKAPPTCCSNFCLQRVEEEGVNRKEQYILFQIG